MTLAHDTRRFWRPSFGTGAHLTRIIANLLRREDPRIVAQDAQVKVIALMNARKAILPHRQEELRAQIAAARAGHKPTTVLLDELKAVNLEILSIG